MRQLRDATIFALIAAVSIAALRTYSLIMFTEAWQESFWEVLPETAVSGLRVGLFWLLCGGLLSLVLLRLAPGIGLVDVVMGGFVGVWALAYIGANVLGPIGLFRWWTIWAAIIGCVFWLWRGGMPAIEWRPLRPGQKLALLAFALTAPTLALLQLGSPIPPHFDTFAPPSSAQRIVTFGMYRPFDNDPFGYWDAASQCPGVELLYAFLTIGSGTRLAVMAETAAFLPMMALLVLTTYRAGRALGGDVAGGMAALLLFATVLIRSYATGHGRFVAFTLASAGIGMLLDRRVHPMRLVLGAVFLGTGVAAHAVLGSLGMVVATAPLILGFLSGRWKATLCEIGLLLGATLVAGPFLVIAVRHELPYPALPLMLAAGIAIAIVSARAMPAERGGDGTLARTLVWGGVLALVLTMGVHPNSLGTLHDFFANWRFPTLYFGAMFGMLVMLGQSLQGRAQPGPVMLGVAMGMFGEWAAGKWWQSFPDPDIGFALQGFVRKADFWYPYIFLFPAACLWAEIARRIPRQVAVLALLAVLSFPWHRWADPNYHEHSIVEAWGFQLQLAKGGYWGGTGDRRWAQTDAQFELIDILRDEIKAGRITMDTHIVHITPYVYLYKDTVHFALYTGINDDLYVSEYVFDHSTAGGRFYKTEFLPAAIAKRPTYVVVHDSTVDQRKLADTLPVLPPELGEYEVLFERDGVRLLRYPGRA